MSTRRDDPYWQLHDKFFKGMFIYQAVFWSFIENYLLEYLQKILKPDTIVPIRTESVGPKFSVAISDMIFEIKTTSGTTIQLLFEHKSKPYKNIQRQLVKYLDNFELDYLNEHKEANAPLNIIPIVIYHGVEKWNIPVGKGRLENLLFFDLAHMPDEQIKPNFRSWSGGECLYL